MYIFSNTIYALIRKQISYSFYNFDIIIDVSLLMKNQLLYRFILSPRASGNMALHDLVKPSNCFHYIYYQ